MHNDPTRIPTLLDALRDTWEGQPDLSLSALIGVLQNRGASYGTTDEELLGLLRELEAEHPALLRELPEQPVLITTEGPAHEVSMDGSTVVVRSSANPDQMPSVWKYAAFRPVGPGRPLVVEDTEGFQHRLGVVRLVTVLDAQDAPELAGLERGDIGGTRWLVALEDGARAVLGQRVRVWRPVGRRATAREELRWSRILQCAVGEDMQIAPGGGAGPASLGRVTQIVLLEV